MAPLVEDVGEVAGHGIHNSFIVQNPAVKAVRADAFAEVARCGYLLQPSLVRMMLSLSVPTYICAVVPSLSWPLPLVVALEIAHSMNGDLLLVQAAVGSLNLHH
jgi:hypothetical protein